MSLLAEFVKSSLNLPDLQDDVDIEEEVGAADDET